MAIDLNRTARFIADFEGFVDHIYRDVVGVETWGYGETDPRYRPPNGRISEAEAFALLKKRVQQFADAVEGCVDRRMSNNQHGALTSLAYNIGVGGFCSSTVARLFNQGDIQGAARAFLMWNKGGGRVLPGLDRRRRAEMALFLSNAEDADDLSAEDRAHLTQMAADARATNAAIGRLEIAVRDGTAGVIAQLDAIREVLRG